VGGIALRARTAPAQPHESLAGAHLIELIRAELIRWHSAAASSFAYHPSVELLAHRPVMTSRS